ncbi:MAG: cyanophycin synthetase family protein [Gemmatimonadaceae bacterium]
MTSLHALRGANFWSERPVTRMDLVIGAYEDVSSAQVPGFLEALSRAMPGLAEHRCSIGERGGFLTRLRRGTYAPHIIEHVALELQTMAGHDVGFGKTRGGDEPHEYTMVFEHRHGGVGLRAAALALDTVQKAFAGELASVDHAVTELRAITQSPDAPKLHQHVRCGITGGDHRHETREELTRRGLPKDAIVVDVAPSYILQAGLPYSRSDIAIILDAHPSDVPERYRDMERARKLVSVLADAVPRSGTVIAPAREWEVQNYARDAGCSVAIFATDDDVTGNDRRVARAVATVQGGRIVIERSGHSEDAGLLRDDAPPVAQVTAALAMSILEHA